MGISMMELPALHGVGTLAHTLSQEGLWGTPLSYAEGPEVLLGLSLHLSEIQAWDQ